MLATFSHSTCATARLFFLKSLFDEKKNEKNIIITDKDGDMKLLELFGEKITGKDWKKLITIADFLEMSESTTGNYIIAPSLLETSGHIDYLKRKTLYEIQRGANTGMDTLIETLIELGYSHSEYIGEFATYKREGSIVTLTHAQTGNTIHIEWFDTEIDSIIEINNQGTRTFRENIWIKNEKIEQLNFERKAGVLNEELLGMITKGSILIGCDFHPEIEKLRKITDTHFTDFHREDSISLDVSIPDIPHIDALKHYIEENQSHANIRFYTKNEKSVNEFLEFHKLSGCKVIPVSKNSLESCEIKNIQSDNFGTNENEGNGGSGVETVGAKKKNSDSGAEREGASFLTTETFDTFGHKSMEVESRFLPSQEGREQGDAGLLRSTRNDEQKYQPTIRLSDYPTLIITDDILGEIFVRTRSKKSLAKNLDLLLHLNPGDHVVHREHGIARFVNVVDKTLGDIRREYLELHYAGGDKLFVPLTEIYRVSKYVGELEPELTSLTGKEWERTLEKTDEELEQIATELIDIASKRTLARGITFGTFPEEEKQFRSGFPYDYTLDQATAIDEIFRDMESEYPMDRLLSGDVGFGKTEVAMNAMYKAVLSGYQVAVISPLLVLADEHYETFLERFTEYGINIECLTRMTSTSDEKRILEGLKAGTVDILVGTHKLLSENLRWKKLGLLIIDEEHKFGVAHKETIKKMRANVDILALSATPIPRSLNLALSGLKKVSLLTTAPKKKKPIETIVSTWIESTIAHAINYELNRGGQIIIVHNRIRGMEQMEKEIENIVASSQLLENKKRRQIIKEGVFDVEEKQGNGGSGVETVGAKKKNSDSRAEGGGASFSTTESFDTFDHKSMEDTSREENYQKIIITHGQMNGDIIEERIHAFKKGEYNILLTTTIIENGVNFLRANTIIIIDPEDFGLAQLHQLRGRVGRKGEQGYCYLMYRKPELAAIEKERIITIANNTHLGAGFEIAMRDMEIRGAGDVLGFKQAGKSKEIGLTLYFRMLEEKIAEIKEEKHKKKPVKIELELSYALDDTLFLSETDKLNFFREIENIETVEELEEIEEEFTVARSKLLEETEGVEKITTSNSHLTTHNLFLLLRARIIFSEYGLESLKKVGQNYIFDFYDGTKTDKIRGFLDRFDPKNRMVLLSVKKIRAEARYWKGAREFLEEITN